MGVPTKCGSHAYFFFSQLYIPHITDSRNSEWCNLKLNNMTFCRHILTKYISPNHTWYSLKCYNGISTWIWAMSYVISLGLFTARFRTSLPVNLKVFWKWPNLWSIFSVLPMERKENITVGINTLKLIQYISGIKIMWRKCL